MTSNRTTSLIPGRKRQKIMNLPPTKKLKFFFYSLIMLCALLFVEGAFSTEPSKDELPTLTLSCKDADVRDILRAIAIQYHVNIVPDSSVSGSVTIHLANVPLEVGLETLLFVNGFTYEKKNGIYLVRKTGSSLGTVTVTAAKERMSIDVENADVKQVLREISRQAQINIVSEGDLAGSVTAQLYDVPIEEGLRTLLVVNGFTLNVDNGIYRVARSNLEKSSSFAIFSRKGLLSIDVKNAPVEDLLREIAAQSKINLSTVGNVRGNITLRLVDVTLEEALMTITSSHGYAYRKVGDIYLVGDPMMKPGQANPLLTEKVVYFNHIAAEEFLTMLPSDIPKTIATPLKDINAVALVGTEEMIARVEKFIREIDVVSDEIRSRRQDAISIEVDSEGLLTVDVKDALLSQVIREIAIRTGVDVIMLSEMTTKVNLRLDQVTLDEVFTALFKGSQYSYKKESKDGEEFYLIGSGAVTQGQSNPLTVVKKIKLAYLKPSELQALLPATIPQTNVVLAEEQNAVVVMGTEELVAEVEKYINEVDSPVPQVMIEALLLEVSRGQTRDLGFEWGGSMERSDLKVVPEVGITFDTLTELPKSFYASLNALFSENKARVLGQPKVATTSGKKATITVGWTDYFETTIRTFRGEEEVPTYGGYYRTGFNVLESGITLEITPWVGATKEITVEIHPEVKDAKLISKEHSTIAQRTVDTTVRVKDGETIVIGGLLQERETTEERKVPVLGSIPLLGNLFKNSHKVSDQTELVIIIQPRIINRSAEGKGASNK